MLSCRRRYEQYAAAASLKNSANSRTTPCASVIPPARSAASNSSCTDCTGTGSTVNESQASDRRFRSSHSGLSERLRRVAGLRVDLLAHLPCTYPTSAAICPRRVRGAGASRSRSSSTRPLRWSGDPNRCSRPGLSRLMCRQDKLRFPDRAGLEPSNLPLCKSTADGATFAAERDSFRLRTQTLQLPRKSSGPPKEAGLSGAFSRAA
jgi:hypothetical protein